MDVIAYQSGGAPGSADVSIDGKKPSEFPECYYITGPSEYRLSVCTERLWIEVLSCEENDKKNEGDRFIRSCSVFLRGG